MRLSSTRPAAAAALLTVALALTGCSTGSANEKKETPDAASAVDEGAFPVTIDHAFGSTTIEEEPKRVATLGWTDQDAVLALGVIPVGSTKLTWGGNAAGSSDCSTPSWKRWAEPSRCATTTPTARRSPRWPSSPPT